jgi:hypothetical protein
LGPGEWNAGWQRPAYQQVAAVLTVMVDPFQPVQPGGNWHLNAVVEDWDDLAIAMGFDEAAGVLVEHWRTRGPNDLLFLPILYSHRHSLEVVLKAAINEAAARLRVDGRTDADLQRETLGAWLASPKAGHKLVVLGERLDQLLQELKLESLPPETHELLTTIHQLDPNGDAFKYATVRDPQTKAHVPAPRPNSTHVDVVAMSAHFAAAFNLLAGGVMTVLDQYREYQDEMRTG